MFGPILTILGAKTKQELGIDWHTLPANANDLVWAKCSKCESELLREFRCLNETHVCPSRVLGKIKCANCDQYRNSSEYGDQKHSICSNCVQMVITNRLAYLCEHHHLDINALTAVYLRQRGRCFYTSCRLFLGPQYDCDTDFLAVQLDQSEPLWERNVILVVRGYAQCASNTLKRARYEVVQVDPLAKRPFRARATDAGYDVYSVENVTIEPHSTAEVRIGLCISAPPGKFYTVEGRSGVRRLGTKPFRSIMDATYTGELSVTMENWQDKPYTVRVGDRVAQIIFDDQEHADFDMVTTFSQEYSERGTKGWGSSGK